MESSSWLSSLCVDAEPEDQEASVVSDAQKEDKDEEGECKDAPETAASAVDELVAAGFARSAAEEALKASSGDFDEALAALVAKGTQSAKRRRLGGVTLPSDQDLAGDVIEIDGVQCALTDSRELTLRLPHDPEVVGPVVGRQAADGSGLVFEGMDSWLWELHDSHRPRAAALPSSFEVDAVAAALDDGAPYVWDGFADESEIRAANEALEAMFAKKEMTRGSDKWIDECAEGGHARNRRSLEGQRRDDACGFWDLQGNDPTPPPAIEVLFRRLEAAAERLRQVHGWPLLCSRQGMGAVYDGKGACYPQHRDNEWQRHLHPLTLRPGAKRKKSLTVEPPGAWMCFREITMLAYVNLPGCFGEDEAGVKAGGRLRCYVDTKRGDLTGSTARELRDVAPLGGRAVVFRSRELLHEVLPSFGRRYCLTLWFQTPSDL